MASLLCCLLLYYMFLLLSYAKFKGCSQLLKQYPVEEYVSTRLRTALTGFPDLSHGTVDVLAKCLQAQAWSLRYVTPWFFGQTQKWFQESDNLSIAACWSTSDKLWSSTKPPSLILSIGS